MNDSIFIASVVSSSESRFVSCESILLNKSSGNVENGISDKVHDEQIQRKIEDLDNKICIVDLLFYNIYYGIFPCMKHTQLNDDSPR